MDTLPRLRLIVLSCLLLLASLAGVQAYLIRNTYQLAAATYRSNLKSALQRVSGQDAAANDSVPLLLQWAANQYACRRLSKGQFTQVLVAIEQKATRRVNAQLRQQARQQPLLQGVTLDIRCTRLLIQHDGRLDTIRWAPATPPPAFVASPDYADSFKLGTNSGDLALTAASPHVPAAPHVSYELVRWVRTPPAPAPVWEHVAGVAGLALLLLLAVVVVFYQVVQSAIQQRKIAVLKTDLANNITHELKTPLSSIGLTIKLLRRVDTQQPTQRQALLETLERQHGKLTHTVERVLESALTGELPVHLAAADLPAYLRAYAQEVRAGHHQVQFAIAPGSLLLHTDLLLLEGVLHNVLDNARKYSPVGSRITIRAYGTATSYCIAITDEGPGIAPAQQAAIFDKFYRAPEHNLHTAKGLGLGLFLSRRTMQQLGGALTLAQSSLQGSTFLIQLPLT